jgi:hypothetical protein
MSAPCAKPNGHLSLLRVLGPGHVWALGVGIVLVGESMGWNFFRRKWPLDSIKRGYVHPGHPIPALMLLVLCGLTYFSIYLGYGRQLLVMTRSSAGQ